MNGFPEVEKFTEKSVESVLHDPENLEWANHIQTLHEQYKEKCKKLDLFKSDTSHLHNARKALLNNVMHLSSPLDNGLLGESIRQDIACKGRFPLHLDNSRAQLYQFFIRRRDQLYLEKATLLSRISKYIKNPSQWLQASTPIVERIDLLTKEIELTNFRINRLKPQYTQRDGYMEETPLAVSSSKTPLYTTNVSLTNSTTSIFLADYYVRANHFLTDLRCNHLIKKFMKHINFLPYSHPLPILNKAFESSQVLSELRPLCLSWIEKYYLMSNKQEKFALPSLAKSAQNFTTLPLLLFDTSKIDVHLANLSSTFRLATPVELDSGLALSYQILMFFSTAFQRFIKINSLSTYFFDENGKKIKKFKHQPDFAKLQNLMRQEVDERDLFFDETSESSSDEDNSENLMNSGDATNSTSDSVDFLMYRTKTYIKESYWLPFVSLRANHCEREREQMAILRSHLSRLVIPPPVSLFDIKKKQSHQNLTRASKDATSLSSPLSPDSSKPMSEAYKSFVIHSSAGASSEGDGPTVKVRNLLEDANNAHRHQNMWSSKFKPVGSFGDGGLYFDALLRTEMDFMKCDSWEYVSHRAERQAHTHLNFMERIIKGEGMGEMGEMGGMREMGEIGELEKDIKYPTEGKKHVQAKKLTSLYLLRHLRLLHLRRRLLSYLNYFRHLQRTFALESHQFLMSSTANSPDKNQFLTALERPNIDYETSARFFKEFQGANAYSAANEASGFDAEGKESKSVLLGFFDAREQPSLVERERWKQVRRDGEPNFQMNEESFINLYHQVFSSGNSISANIRPELLMNPSLPSSQTDPVSSPLAFFSTSPFDFVNFSSANGKEYRTKSADATAANDQGGKRSSFSRIYSNDRVSWVRDVPFVMDNANVSIIHDVSEQDLEDLMHQILMLGSFFIQKFETGVGTRIFETAKLRGDIVPLPREDLGEGSEEKKGEERREDKGGGRRDGEEIRLENLMESTKYPICDRVALLLDLMEAETAYNQAKARICQILMEIWNHTVDVHQKKIFAQHITNTMAERPLLDFDGCEPSACYAMAVSSLDVRANLLRRLCVHQIKIFDVEKKMASNYLHSANLIASNRTTTIDLQNRLVSHAIKSKKAEKKGGQNSIQDTQKILDAHLGNASLSLDGSEKWSAGQNAEGTSEERGGRGERGERGEKGNNVNFIQSTVKESEFPCLDILGWTSSVLEGRIAREAVRHENLMISLFDDSSENLTISIFDVYQNLANVANVDILMQESMRTISKLLSLPSSLSSTANVNFSFRNLYVDSDNEDPSGDEGDGEEAKGEGREGEEREGDLGETTSERRGKKVLFGAVDSERKRERVKVERMRTTCESLDDGDAVMQHSSVVEEIAIKKSFYQVSFAIWSRLVSSQKKEWKEMSTLSSNFDDSLYCELYASDSPSLSSEEGDTSESSSEDEIATMKSKDTAAVEKEESKWIESKWRRGRGERGEKKEEKISGEPKKKEILKKKKKPQATDLATDSRTRINIFDELEVTLKKVDKNNQIYETPALFAHFSPISPLLSLSPDSLLSSINEFVDLVRTPQKLLMETTNKILKRAQHSGNDSPSLSADYSTSTHQNQNSSIAFRSRLSVPCVEEVYELSSRHSVVDFILLMFEILMEQMNVRVGLFDSMTETEILMWTANSSQLKILDERKISMRKEQRAVSNFLETPSLSAMFAGTSPVSPSQLIMENSGAVIDEPNSVWVDFIKKFDETKKKKLEKLRNTVLQKNSSSATIFENHQILKIIVRDLFAVEDFFDVNHFAGPCLAQQLDKTIMQDLFLTDPSRSVSACNLPSKIVELKLGHQLQTAFVWTLLTEVQRNFIILSPAYAGLARSFAENKIHNNLSTSLSVEKGKKSSSFDFLSRKMEGLKYSASNFALLSLLSLFRRSVCSSHSHLETAFSRVSLQDANKIAIAARNMLQSRDARAGFSEERKGEVVSLSREVRSYSGEKKRERDDKEAFLYFNNSMSSICGVIEMGEQSRSQRKISLRTEIVKNCIMEGEILCSLPGSWANNLRSIVSVIWSASTKKLKEECSHLSSANSAHALHVLKLRTVAIISDIASNIACDVSLQIQLLDVNQNLTDVHNFLPPNVSPFSLSIKKKNTRLSPEVTSVASPVPSLGKETANEMDTFLFADASNFSRLPSSSPFSLLSLYDCCLATPICIKKTLEDTVLHFNNLMPFVHQKKRNSTNLLSQALGANQTRTAVSGPSEPDDQFYGRDHLGESIRYFVFDENATSRHMDLLTSKTRQKKALTAPPAYEFLCLHQKSTISDDFLMLLRYHQILLAFLTVSLHEILMGIDNRAVSVYSQFVRNRCGFGYASKNLLKYIKKMNNIYWRESVSTVAEALAFLKVDLESVSEKLMSFNELFDQGEKRGEGEGRGERSGRGSGLWASRMSLDRGSLRASIANSGISTGQATIEERKPMRRVYFCMTYFLMKKTCAIYWKMETALRTLFFDLTSKYQSANGAQREHQKYQIFLVNQAINFWTSPCRQASSFGRVWLPVSMESGRDIFDAHKRGEKEGEASLDPLAGHHVVSYLKHPLVRNRRNFKSWTNEMNAQVKSSDDRGERGERGKRGEEGTGGEMRDRGEEDVGENETAPWRDATVSHGLLDENLMYKRTHQNFKDEIIFIPSNFTKASISDLYDDDLMGGSLYSGEKERDRRVTRREEREEREGEKEREKVGEGRREEKRGEKESAYNSIGIKLQKIDEKMKSVVDAQWISSALSSSKKDHRGRDSRGGERGEERRERERRERRGDARHQTLNEKMLNDIEGTYQYRWIEQGERFTTSLIFPLLSASTSVTHYMREIHPEIDTEFAAESVFSAELKKKLSNKAGENKEEEKKHLLNGYQDLFREGIVPLKQFLPYLNKFYREIYDNFTDQRNYKGNYLEKLIRSKLEQLLSSPLSSSPLVSSSLPAVSSLYYPSDEDILALEREVFDEKELRESRVEHSQFAGISPLPLSNSFSLHQEIKCNSASTFRHGKLLHDSISLVDLIHPVTRNLAEMTCHSLNVQNLSGFFSPATKQRLSGILVELSYDYRHFEESIKKLKMGDLAAKTKKFWHQKLETACELDAEVSFYGAYLRYQKLKHYYFLMCEQSHLPIENFDENLSRLASRIQCDMNEVEIVLKNVFAVSLPPHELAGVSKFLLSLSLTSKLLRVVDTKVLKAITRTIAAELSYLNHLLPLPLLPSLPSPPESSLSLLSFHTASKSSFVSKIDVIWQFANRLRTRGTLVRTNSGENGFVFAEKDINNCLEELGRSLLQFSAGHVVRANNYLELCQILMRQLETSYVRNSRTKKKVQRLRANLATKSQVEAIDRSALLVFESDFLRRTVRNLMLEMLHIDRSVRAEVRSETAEEFYDLRRRYNVLQLEFGEFRQNLANTANATIGTVTETAVSKLLTLFTSVGIKNSLRTHLEQSMQTHQNISSPYKLLPLDRRDSSPTRSLHISPSLLSSSPLSPTLKDSMGLLGEVYESLRQRKGEIEGGEGESSHDYFDAIYWECVEFVRAIKKEKARIKNKRNTEGGLVDWDTMETQYFDANFLQSIKNIHVSDGPQELLLAPKNLMETLHSPFKGQPSLDNLMRDTETYPRLPRETRRLLVELVDEEERDGDKLREQLEIATGAILKLKTFFRWKFLMTSSKFDAQMRDYHQKLSSAETIYIKNLESETRAKNAQEENLRTLRTATLANDRISSLSLQNQILAKRVADLEKKTRTLEKTNQALTKRNQEIDSLKRFDAERVILELEEKEKVIANLERELRHYKRGEERRGEERRGGEGRREEERGGERREEGRGESGSVSPLPQIRVKSGVDRKMDALAKENAQLQRKIKRDKSVMTKVLAKLNQPPQPK